MKYGHPTRENQPIKKVHWKSRGHYSCQSHVIWLPIGMISNQFGKGSHTVALRPFNCKYVVTVSQNIVRKFKYCSLHIRMNQATERCGYIPSERGSKHNGDYFLRHTTIPPKKKAPDCTRRPYESNSMQLTWHAVVKLLDSLSFQVLQSRPVKCTNLGWYIQPQKR
jgi:hypothetical protein